MTGVWGRVCKGAIEACLLSWHSVRESGETASSPGYPEGLTQSRLETGSARLKPTERDRSRPPLTS